MPADWPADLQLRLREFARARNWEQYHTPRNLSALIASEAGELLALFRWDQDSVHLERDRVEEELANVLLGVLRFADVAGIDLNGAGVRKIERNSAKYVAGDRRPDAGPPAADRAVVCGVDAGTFASSSYVAWLRAHDFVLTTYRPTREAPLPEPPPGWGSARVIALDLPQGLARSGEKRRTVDVAAQTPTQVLPANRAELAGWRLYGGFIAAGVDTYWSIHSGSLGRIVGLEQACGGRPLVAETYPRYVIKRLWPDLRIPSKRKAPEEYTGQIWARLEARGFRSLPAPSRPDHVDAMLCALAAQACLEANGLPLGTVGEAPYIDVEERLIREGYIVAP